MKRRKNGFVYAILLISLLLNGCGKSGQIVTVEMPKEAVEKVGSGIKDIYEYEIQAFWPSSYKKQIKRQLEYENNNSKMLEHYFSEQGIYQNHLDASGNIVLTTSDKTDILSKRMVKGNGFYQEQFQVLEANAGQWKVWVSPSGKFRLVRGYDSRRNSFYLYLEQEDGKVFPVLQQIDRKMDCDIRCVWSEDGDRAFIQLVSLAIFPESKEEIKAREQLDGGKAPDQYEPLIDDMEYGEVWMLSHEGEKFEAECIYTKQKEEQDTPDLIVSKDGRQLLLYLSWEADKILCGEGGDPHHTAIFLREVSDGEWKASGILHFNSQKGKDKHYHRVHFVDILLDEDLVFAVTEDGYLKKWDVTREKWISEEKVLKKGYKFCKIYLSDDEEPVVYTSMDEKIFEYRYDEAMASYVENQVYYAPAESSVFSMKLFAMSGNLFVTYTLGGLGKESARMQMVLLRLVE